MSTRRTLLRLLVPSAVLLACGGEDLLLPSEGEPATIELVSGDGQTGRVGMPLENPIVVRVADSQDRPVVGAVVAFELLDPSEGAEIVPGTAPTDADGLASAQVVLGSRIGTGRGVARVETAGGQRTLTATFTLVAVSADANELVLVSGQDQSAPVGTALGAPLVVAVEDAFGNPVPGVTIDWAPEGGGTVSAPTTTTDAAGRAAVTRTLGPQAGEQRTVASAPGLVGSPLVFVHTATAGSAARVEIVGGNAQSGPVGTRLPDPLVVRVLDAARNPVAGVGVTWVVAAGGGSVDPVNTTTGADGRASTRWTLGGTPGANRVEAVVSGIGTATFTATAVAGAGAALAIRTQPPATAALGAEFERAPVVQLQDAAGNDVATSGVTVTVAIASGDGTLVGPTTRRSDGQGRAEFPGLRITRAVGRHTLIFAADGYTSVTSSAIEVGRAASRTEITEDAPDPSVPGQGVTVRVRVRGEAGHPPSGSVAVTASGGSEQCSAPLAGSGADAEGSCTIVLDAAGDRTLTATYAGDASHAGSSDAEPHQVIQPNAPPVAVNDEYETQENTTLVVEAPDGVLANDLDPDTPHDQLRAQQASEPQNGTVELAEDGSFTYTPNSGFEGEDSFTYRTTDGAATSEPATVRITVHGDGLLPGT